MNLDSAVETTQSAKGAKFKGFTNSMHSPLRRSKHAAPQVRRQPSQLRVLRALRG